MYIKAKNGNVVETEDVEHAKRALVDGHEVYDTDPRVKSPKAKKWSPEGSDEADGDDAGNSDD